MRNSLEIRLRIRKLSVRMRLRSGLNMRMKSCWISVILCKILLRRIRTMFRVWVKKWRRRYWIYRRVLLYRRRRDKIVSISWQKISRNSWIDYTGNFSLTKNIDNPPIKRLPKWWWRYSRNYRNSWKKRRKRGSRRIRLY